MQGYTLLLTNTSFPKSKVWVKKVVLQYRNLRDIEKCSIFYFSDAAFVSLLGTSPQSGHFLFLYKNDRRYSPIRGNKKNIQHVINITLAAKTLALT